MFSNLPTFFEGAAKVIGGLIAIWGVIKMIAKTLVKPLAAHLAKIDVIYSEIRPNGGGSIKDAVNKLQASVGRMEKRQKCWLQLHNRAVFEMDGAGYLTWANREYLHLLGATFDEVEGRGWKNYLADSSTWNEWAAAVADRRDFNACFSIRTERGDLVPVCVETLAIKDEKGELGGYVGNLTRRE